jgi:hypothetical protein
VASRAVVASECQERGARERGSVRVMGAAEVVKEVAAACAYPSTARQGAVVAGRGIAADSGVGTVGSALVGRQRDGVAAGALEGAEGVEGPDGTRAAACRRKQS